MRFIFVIMIVLFAFANQALAISPINIDSIKAAHNYGKVNSQLSLEEFLQPWISYEEKAAALSSNSEHAYLYTPFLLLATDSREKQLNGKNATLEDSERILSDYAGTLSLSVFLIGEDKNFNQNCTVIIKQDKKTVKPYQVIIPIELQAVPGTPPGLFGIQCYFYFFEKELQMTKPIHLIVITGDKKEHNFYFDLDKIR